jgi:hypothetical protein
MIGRERPILLKKSAMVSTTEKYALEIEIFTSIGRFRVQISRSGAQKKRFQRSVCGQSGRTDFFNRIGRFPACREILKNRPLAGRKGCPIAGYERGNVAV